mmetsp:Transcript_14629/g.35312  ORF Transcript_14629/g.35312 Transcript_14629/m.35312 type:complete len:257 (-) Transcript_14629:112-882(-)
MAKERVASETEQKSVEQEEEATLELSSAENLKSGFKKGSNTKSSALDIVGKQHTSVSDLKKEVSTLGKRAATAKVTRNALQRQLDTELNKLSSEQIHAHDIKKPKSTVREGFTETVKAAMSKAKGMKKAAAGKKVVAGKPSDEHMLAQIGAQLLRMPAVLKAVVQSLSTGEAEAASKIADSLGSSFSTPEPVDDAIAAEVAVATAEAAGDAPLLPDGVTKAVNASALLPPVDDAQMAVYAQAVAEAEISPARAGGK